MSNEKDGWHDFTLVQAKEYIAEVKAQYPRAWTGIYRCTEEMVALAEQEKKRADKLAALLHRLRANHPTTKGDQWGVAQMASGLETSALWREVDAALDGDGAWKEGT